MSVTCVNRRNGHGNEKERIKVTLRILLLLLALSEPLWAAAPKPVTLVVDDVPVAQVLQALVAQENRNLVVSPDVTGSLSLNLTRVPRRQALQTVVTSAGLVLQEDGGIFMSILPPGSASSRHGGCLRHRSSHTAFRSPGRMPETCKKTPKGS